MKKSLLSLLLLSLLLLSLCLGLTSCGDKFGTITLELYPEYAPATVENFVALAQDGFYDGLIFHRVISGFMVQGGDPLGNGTGGADEDIVGEFANNGYTGNTLEHTRGTISMARSGHPYEAYHNMGYIQLSPEELAPYYNSASSQFFIVHEDSPHLNGQYAAFGRVVEGMEVVDAIAAVETDENDRPLSDVVISRIYIVESEAAEDGHITVAIEVKG
ncbi:MAG: peptidylprolyl isomerase [Clostridia bacterium]|nr:peptidylprolyl isomerase [Clostridia bacterium]